MCAHSLALGRSKCLPFSIAELGNIQLRLWYTRDYSAVSTFPLGGDRIHAAQMHRHTRITSLQPHHVTATASPFFSRFSYTINTKPTAMCTRRPLYGFGTYWQFSAGKGVQGIWPVTPCDSSNLWIDHVHTMLPFSEITARNVHKHIMCF